MFCNVLFFLVKLVFCIEFMASNSANNIAIIRTFNVSSSNISKVHERNHSWTPLLPLKREGGGVEFSKFSKKKGGSDFFLKREGLVK